MLRQAAAMRSVLFLIAAAILLHAQSDPDPVLVLDKARTRLQALSQTLEKYVCVENVERSYFQRVTPRETPVRVESQAACGSTAAQRRLESTDRVRLEVTLSDGRELHSWPGATRFDTRDVDELIRNGPVSTGSFGGYLAGVFDNPGVVFQFRKKLSQDSKTFLEYSYSVPLQVSHFQVKVAGNWRPVAYEGEFRIDPKSLDLEQLVVRTTEVPSEAPFCSAATTLEYRSTRIGDATILLPSQSQLEIDLRSGEETRNTTTFSSCREYQAESEIVFESAPEAASRTAPATAGWARVPLPLGLPVTLALTEPIDTNLASAGDPVSAKVVKPIRRPGSNEQLIPAGAIVNGRIRRVEHHLLPTPYFRVVLAFNRLEMQGAVAPFFAHSDPNPDLARELGANLAMRDTGIWFWGVGTFLFPSNKDHIVIPAGYESKWFTLSTGGR
jgi:hypothetical protein